MATACLILLRIVLAAAGIVALILVVKWIFFPEKEKKENPLADRIGAASEKLHEKDRVATEAESALKKFGVVKSKNPEKRIKEVENKFEEDEGEAEKKKED